MQLLLAFILSTAVALLGYWRGSLARSGVVGAVLVGTLTFGMGGWLWGVLLAIFFFSSSLLSHFKEERKRQVAADKFDKGHRRDFGQAMANGGPGALVALLNGLFPHPAWLPLFVGIMATVNADTWATELGTLSQRPPRLITNFKVVERGTSGGVSPLGTAVSAAGGLLIGLVAGLGTADLGWWLGALLGLLGGLMGSLFDSFLGATVQAMYYSDHLKKETERRIDKAGHPTRHLRGWRWLNNDWVNALSSVLGGIVALVVWSFVIGH